MTEGHKQTVNRTLVSLTSLIPLSVLMGLTVRENSTLDLIA